MSRTQLGLLAVVAVVATRLVIGWHFYKEGTSKLAAKNWTAAPALAQAKGDFAGLFTSMTPQKYALLDLLVDQDAEEIEFDVEPTVDIWWHHREMLGDYYGFEDLELEQQIKKDRAETRKVVIELRDKRRDAFKDIEDLHASLLSEEDLEEAPVALVKANVAKQEQIALLQKDYEALNALFRDAESTYKRQEQEILTIRAQNALSIALIEDWKNQLEIWIAANYDDLTEYFEYKDRVAKNAADPTRQEVATLEGQASTIESDMKKKAAPLVAGLAGIWEGFNTQLNDLAVATQSEDRDKFEIARPDQAPTRLTLIDRFIPWFDTIIGALLILGLFTRPAAIAAAGFLLSVIMMQLPWADGAVPTYYQAIEMFALLVLAAVGAGRYAGLDLLLRCIYYRVFPPKSAAMARYESQRSMIAEPVGSSQRNAEPLTV